MPYEAENWYALSYDKYFSKQRFLDICRCAFNISKKLLAKANKYLKEKNIEIKVASPYQLYGHDSKLLL